MVMRFRISEDAHQFKAYSLSVSEETSSGTVSSSVGGDERVYAFELGETRQWNTKTPFRPVIVTASDVDDHIRPMIVTAGDQQFVSVYVGDPLDLVDLLGDDEQHSREFVAEIMDIATKDTSGNEHEGIRDATETRPREMLTDCVSECALREWKTRNNVHLDGMGEGEWMHLCFRVVNYPRICEKFSQVAFLKLILGTKMREMGMEVRRFEWNSDPKGVTTLSFVVSECHGICVCVSAHLVDLSV